MPAPPTVVVTHNQAAKLERFVATWSEHHDGRLVIACSAPSSDVLDVVSEYRLWPGVTVVVHHDNVGFNVAVNRALCEEIFDREPMAIPPPRPGKAIDPQPFAICNDDLWFQGPALTDLAKHLVDGQHPTPNAEGERAPLAAVGPRQVNERNLLTASGFFGDPTVKPHEPDFAKPPTKASAIDSDEAITLAGSCIVWNRLAWEQLIHCAAPTVLDARPYGAYLETRHYFGETFACYHARAHGWKLGYRGSITVGHSWHSSSDVGGYGERHLAADRELFRQTCDDHDPAIPRF